MRGWTPLHIACWGTTKPQYDLVIVEQARHACACVKHVPHMPCMCRACAITLTPLAHQSSPLLPLLPPDTQSWPPNSTQCTQDTWSTTQYPARQILLAAAKAKQDGMVKGAKDLLNGGTPGPHGTSAAPLRHLCGTSAAPLPRLCGTSTAL